MIRIDLHSEVPIYAQLRNQIVEAIARGDVAAGEPLPTVRQLAEDLGINPMTVNKTYGILKQEGYLDKNLRKGAVAMSSIPREPQFLQDALPTLRLLIAECILHGITEDEFLRESKLLYQQFQEV